MFSPKSFEVILEEMIAYVRMRSPLTDFNIGSITRTILEAAALQDDELYYQMVQLLKMFSFMNAVGSELDRRAADFDEGRLLANEAYGEVYIYDNVLERTYIATAVTAGDPNINVVDASVFGALVPPFNARVGEGTPEAEVVVVNAIVVNQLQLAAGTTFSHPATPIVLDEFTAGASRVSYISGAADRSISSGLGTTKPATGINAAQNFIDSEIGTLVNGDFLSDAISALSLKKGKLYNAPDRSIVEFTSASPFADAGVINLEAFGGGRDLETNDEFRDRLMNKLASLVKATILAIQSAAAGVEDTDTGQAVTRSKVLEDFILDLVKTYIDDGSGIFSPDTDIWAQTTFFANDVAPTNLINLTSSANFSAAGFLILSPNVAARTEIREYTSINPGGPPYQFNLTANTTYNHNIGEGAWELERVNAATEFGQRFFELDHIAVIPGTVVLYQLPVAALQPTPLVLGTDYLLNEGVGQIELAIAAPTGSAIYATYQWYTNLVEEVQRVLDGDLDDPVSYPGVRAAGIKLLVEAAVAVNIDVTVSLSVLEGGTDKADLITAAELALTGYISGLPLGQDVIRNEMIQRVMELSEDIVDITMTIPAGNITVLENEVPVPHSINVF